MNWISTIPDYHAPPDTQPAPAAGYTVEDFCPRGCARKLAPSYYEPAKLLFCGDCSVYVDRKR